VTARVLVAGVGNIFFSDDGFGPEVARRMASDPMPDGVKVVDFGIRGVHLAYELLDGYDVAILVDAMPSGEPPGTISVLQPEIGDGGPPDVPRVASVDAHSMEPESVLALVAEMGGQVGKVLIVGCEPADASEGMGLTPPVDAAVDTAVGVVRDLIAREVCEGNAGKGEQP
jgi:hydrogenase maturation protease